jgi:MFS family permease
MRQELRWHDYITINIYWLGFNIASGSITPLLLPYLVALFVPAEQKNTYLANIRVISLAVAMLIQPVAGMLSDRSAHPMGRRRPYIIGGTLGNLLFLLVIGIAPMFADSTLTGSLLTGVSVAYLVLLVGVVFLQITGNVALGAVLGLIPDLVPEHQRGRASGVKAVMELLPIFGAILIGQMLGQGRIWLTIGIVMAGFLLSMLITVFTVHETPLKEKPSGRLREPVLRLVALTAIFVAATRAGVGLVSFTSGQLAQWGADVGMQVAVIGLAGLLGMAGSILVGVYLGAWVGIGKDAPQQTSFIWWVINRLLFLAGVGSIQGFALYYLTDVLEIADPELWTGVLMAVVAVFLIATALGGGYLADRIGRKRLVGLAGVIAAGGTGLLLLANSIPLVIVAGSIVGIGAGTFMATNWALGTDLVPPDEAGRYLGISNLAGAGAGIVGQGIGGPMADFFNGLRPGLGYMVIFGLYGVLFLLSTVTLTKIQAPRR